MLKSVSGVPQPTLRFDDSLGGLKGLSTEYSLLLLITTKQIQQREKVQEQSLEEVRQSLPGVPSQWSHRMHLIPSAMSCEL